MSIGYLEGGVWGVFSQDQVESFDNLTGSMSEGWMYLPLHIAEVLFHLIKTVDLPC
jgi:hypothetical protein